MFIGNYVGLLDMLDKIVLIPKSAFIFQTYSSKSYMHNEVLLTISSDQIKYDWLCDVPDNDDVMLLGQ